MAEPLKNLIGPDVVAQLAAALELPGAFATEALPALPDLELKARVRHLANAARAHLPPPWPDALERIVRALPPPIGSDGDLLGVPWVWVLAQIVEDHGLERPEASLLALREITMRFTAEFAIRPYLEAHPDLTFAHLSAWVRDPNVHVRRLVSEGSRPRLPWGRRLTLVQAEPARTVALLEQLVDDPERYVQRSVANHLNDISKDHPDLAVQVAARWLEAPTDDRRWVVRHALRGLVKQGHSDALALLGFPPPDLVVESFEVAPREVPIGGELTVRAVLRAAGAQQVLVDYAVFHRRADGSQSPKVFKGTTSALADGQVLTFEKRHSLRPVTTRRYYPGAHRVELRVNGQALAEAAFALTPEA